MSAPKFKDIVKSVADIFKKDFVKDLGDPVSFEMTSEGPSGVEVTSSSTWDYTKSGSGINTTVSATWSHPSGFTLEKLEFDPSAKGSLTTETSLSGLAKGLKLEFKGNDADKGDLSFTYKLPNATVNGGMDFMNFKSFDIAAGTSMGDITAGAKCDVSKGKDGFSTSTAVAAAYSVGALTLGLDVGSNFSKYGVMGSFAVDKTITGAVRADLGGKSPVIQVGGIYKCNKATVMKGKINASSKAIDLSVKHSMDKNMKVTASCAMADFSPKSLTFGVKATLG